jgi:hypothetical protein
LLTRWRDAWRKNIESASERTDVLTLMPHDLHPLVPLLEAITLLAAKGPPGPAPQPVKLSGAAFDQGALLVRACPADQLEELRTKARSLVAAFAFGDSIVALGSNDPNVRELFLVEGDACVTLGLTDPWNPPSRYCVDGDAWTFAAFLRWLRESIIRAGLDESLAFEVEADEFDDEYEETETDDEEDDDGEPRMRTVRQLVSEWLVWRDLDENPILDWRIESEAVIDGYPWWQLEIFGEWDKAQLERLRDRDIDRYYAFIRKHIDADFLPRGKRPLVH